MYSEINDNEVSKDAQSDMPKIVYVIYTAFDISAEIEHDKSKFSK